ncbi:putative oxidoreductase [Paracoccus aminovorans]|uniref:Putative oxidoreductase n=1 Tax=Paracoccus aminovorans TaxID=34004 RepID=A0A1I2YYX6_9RHOB|nr:DoxX family protein [Paracoccus aminovorans]CQR85859.1 membrane protein [Paracoccus aminovorans]SFH30650.1 putative oxidoreductase [Paracoccus aminovorans]
MTSAEHRGAAANGRNTDLAALLLRAVTGAWFLTHGLTKLLVFTPAGTAGYFRSIGLPGALGPLTMVLEIAGGLALIAGLFTRQVALVLAAVLLGAAWFGHGGNGFAFGNPGGGWEYPVLWAVVMLALSALGDGAWSLGRRR